MADQDRIVVDEQGHPRYFSFERSDVPAEGGALALDAPADTLTGATPQESARKFLAANAETLGIALEPGDGLAVRVAVAPTTDVAPERPALRFESEKAMMDTATVSYVQTLFGLPIWQAGISVTTQGQDNAVAAASSTLHYDVVATLPETGLVPFTANGLDASNGAYDEMARAALGASGARLRINRTRLIVYRYDAARRLDPHPYDRHDEGFGGEHPTLPLPEVPATVVDGRYYVVVELMFTLPVERYGALNWQAFIEVATGAVLYLRALVDGATGLVFDRDPITKTGNAANLPNASEATLDLLRDPVTLPDLTGPVRGTQSLRGSFVRLFDNLAPTVAAPTTMSPFKFEYHARTNDFAATNAYYHTDRFFRMVADLGFDVPTYFDGTAFPVPVDHRGLGNVVNANCPGDATGDGIGQVNFALADTGDVAHPISIGADWRVVLHELGGHGILWDHVNSPNFGFSHSAGDSIAVIVNDPASLAPDRFLSFPWVNIGRRHDRPVNGWGWGGVNDVGGYSSEQILATTHFRIYRALGGDAGELATKQFAARTMVYLILRAVGQLTPATNPPSPLAWEGQLETADRGVWTPANPAGTFAGGAYLKVIRWAFEKQGLFRAPGAPATVEGVAPPVDVFIDDGRHGQYGYQPNHWSNTDIWSRRTPGAGGGVHEEPVVGQTNFAYVRIRNRGAQAAKNVVVKGFHALPGAGLTFPIDWAPMTTASLAAPDLAAGDMTGIVVGPFEWTPSQVGHECLFFSVSATGDAGNIDGRVVGPIEEWRLVPHDNNLGQRNVHPVAALPPKGPLQIDWEALPFWVRNNGRAAVRTTVSVSLPEWLARSGWTLDVPRLSRRGLVVRPGTMEKVTLAQTAAGKPFTAEELSRQTDRRIVVTVLQDGIAVGGMTFELTAPNPRDTVPTGPIA